MKLALISTLLLAGCGASASTATGQVRPARFGRTIEELRERYHIPGLSGLVIQGDSTLWEGWLGFRDSEQRLPVTRNTSFHFASLTKPYAAVIVMQLVGEGRLSLEQPVAELGIALASPDTIRLWHLLSHTSEGVPGRAFRYNGNRFGLIDRAMLQATGKPFATLLEERIRGPLGFGPMNSGELARGYDYSRERRNVPVEYPTHFGPAAGMIGTPREMAAFSRALDGEGLLSAALRARMFHPGLAGDSLPYGIGWFVQRYRGEVVQWHYGLWIGTSTLIVRVPSRRLTFVLMANNEMLSAPFRLGSGQLQSSPFAEAFFETFVPRK